MDKIIIKNLRLTGIIGIYPHERVREQEIIINLTLFTDIVAPAQSENIADTVDYTVITNRVTDYVQQSRHLLLEKLVTSVAFLILTEFPRVQKARVRIDKPEILPAADAVGMEIERSQGDF